MSAVSDEKLLAALKEVETGITRFLARQKQMKKLIKIGLIVGGIGLIAFIVFLILGLTISGQTYYMIIALIFMVFFLIGGEVALICLMLKKYVYEEREKSYREILKYINEQLTKKS